MKNLRIVYVPKGKALEYAPLSVSLYRWCSHGCTYCFVPSQSYAKEHGEPYVRKNALELFEKDCIDLEKAGDTREILLSFSTDPYQPLEDEVFVTQKAIKIMHKYNRPYTILTKGGKRSTRDFALMAERKDLCHYATTLTLWYPEDEKKWEPYAAPWRERVEALRAAHALGIRTWASIEPIIDPAQSRYLIAETLDCVDLYKIGKMNHVEAGFPESDLIEFMRSVKHLLDSHNKKYMFKKDTLPYLTEP